MKKRRPPEDPFDQALQAEQTFNPAQQLRAVLRRECYARIVIPSPYVPKLSKTPFLDALRAELDRATVAVNYDLHRKLVMSMRKPE